MQNSNNPLSDCSVCDTLCQHLLDIHAQAAYEQQESWAYQYDGLRRTILHLASALEDHDAAKAQKVIAEIMADLRDTIDIRAKMIKAACKITAADQTLKCTSIMDRAGLDQSATIEIMTSAHLRQIIPIPEGPFESYALD